MVDSNLVLLKLAKYTSIINSQAKNPPRGQRNARSRLLESRIYYDSMCKKERLNKIGGKKQIPYLRLCTQYEHAHETVKV